MATLLLSNNDKQVRGQDLRRTLLQFLHGFQAIENSLSLFASSYATREELLAIKGHADILGEFDGHVGDTACHLRAQMVWQVYEQHKLAEKREWIANALTSLERVKAGTVALLIELHKKKGYMRALGFNPILSYGEIFDRIGWSGFLESLAAQGGVPALDADTDSSSRSDSPAPATPVDVEPIQSFEKSSVPADIGKIPSDAIFSNTSTQVGVVSSESSDSSPLSRSVSFLFWIQLFSQWLFRLLYGSSSVPSFPASTEASSPTSTPDTISSSTPAITSATSIPATTPTITPFTTPSTTQTITPTATSTTTPATPPSTTPTPSRHTKQASSSSNTHRNVTTDSNWDVTNPLTMLRFLTICRLLSFGKKAQRQPTPDATKSMIRCRTDPAFVYEETEKQIEKYYETFGAEYTWGQVISNKDRAGKIFLVREEEAAQVWLAALTADWWMGLGREVGFEGSMQRFLDNTIVTSPRQVECIAAYTSILPIRAEWMIRGTPILLVNRRFCDKGYHSEFYRIIPNTSAWSVSSAVSDSAAVAIGDKSWFAIQSVTLEELQTAPWATTAHYIQISNAGTDRKIYDHIMDNAYDFTAHPPFPHDDDTCSEHVEHIAKVVKTNFSRIVMDTFGEHDQYPFDILQDASKDEYSHIVEQMREYGLGDDVVEGYRRAAKEAEERSGSYMFEHMYTEMPFVVGRQVEGMIRVGGKPTPMGYRWC